MVEFEKLVKALPKLEKGKLESPILFGSSIGNEVDFLVAGKEVVDEASRVLKAGKRVQASEARYPNGLEATISARQSVRTYSNSPRNEQKPNEPKLVKEGFRLMALPVVTEDRRFVRMRFIEQSQGFVGMKKREIRAQGDGGLLETIVLGPDMTDLGSTASATVGDGGVLLFRLAYAPEHKVWVVVVRPTIFIQSEEDAIKEEALKKEGKN